MLEPHRLRVFRSVVESGSVQAAADFLGMTSSAVSQHMSALQRETGLVLFERAGRGIVPTREARVLTGESDDVMRELTRLDHVVSDLREGRTGRITIGYFSSAGYALMPRFVKRLTEEMPEVTVELVLTESLGGSARVDIDVVIETPDAPPRTGYDRTELLDDPYVALLPASHPLADSPRIALIDLRSDTWVSNDIQRNPNHAILVSACAQAGFRPRFSVQAQDQYTSAAFVAAGIGVSVLGRLASLALPAGVRRVELSPPVPVRRISALTRHDSRSRAVTRAEELLVELFATSAPPS